MRRLLLGDNFLSDVKFASCVQRQWFVVVYALQLLCAALCTPLYDTRRQSSHQGLGVVLHQRTYGRRQAEAILKQHNEAGENNNQQRHLCCSWSAAARASEIASDEDGWNR